MAKHRTHSIEFKRQVVQLPGRSDRGPGEKGLLLGHRDSYLRRAASVKAGTRLLTHAPQQTDPATAEPASLGIVLNCSESA
jgi:hypothetical protein